MIERCFACGGAYVPEPGGAVHAYMLSTSGCWAAYGRLLAREYSDPALFASSHRLTVDAYALQHPGQPNDARAVQSIWLHAASLWLVLKEGAEHAIATAALRRLVGKTPASLPDPPKRFAMTLADVLARPERGHAELAHEWASAALEDWSAIHADIARLTTKIRE